MRANVSQKMFPSLPTVGNMTKHRQETMFPQQCFLVCPGFVTTVFHYCLYNKKICTYSRETVFIFHTQIGFYYIVFADSLTRGKYVSEAP